MMDDGQKSILKASPDSWSGELKNPLYVSAFKSMYEIMVMVEIISTSLTVKKFSVLMSIA